MPVVIKILNLPVLICLLLYVPHEVFSCIIAGCCFELCYSAQSCGTGVAPGSVVNMAGAADSPVLPTVGSW